MCMLFPITRMTRNKFLIKFDVAFVICLARFLPSGCHKFQLSSTLDSLECFCLTTNLNVIIFGRLHDHCFTPQFDKSFFTNPSHLMPLPSPSTLVAYDNFDKRKKSTTKSVNAVFF